MDIVAQKREAVKELVRALIERNGEVPNSVLDIPEQYLVTIAVSEMVKMMRESRSEVNLNG